jgi:hypothetical protein
MVWWLRFDATAAVRHASCTKNSGLTRPMVTVPDPLLLAPLPSLLPPLLLLLPPLPPPLPPDRKLLNMSDSRVLMLPPVLVFPRTPFGLSAWLKSRTRRFSSGVQGGRDWEVRVRGGTQGRCRVPWSKSKLCSSQGSQTQLLTQTPAGQVTHCAPHRLTTPALMQLPC